MNSAFKELEEGEKAREEAEKARLLYVAATRAGDLLVIPRSYSKKQIYFNLIADGLAVGSPHIEELALSDFITVEKERRMKELDTDMEALRLFDQAWKVEEVSIKLGISQKTACRYFDKWADIRQDREAIQRELVRRCLMKHIEALKNKLSWAQLLSGYSDKDREEIEEKIEYCQRLLSNLDQVGQADREYLIGEYSSQVLRY